MPTKKTKTPRIPRSKPVVRNGFRPSAPGPITTAATFRLNKSFIVAIDETLTIRVQKVDMPTLLFEGYMPLPLLQSVLSLINKNSDGKADSLAKSFLTMPEADRAAMVEMMQRFTCKAVLEPKFVMEDDGNPEHIPVAMLAFDQLCAIWATLKPKGALVGEADADRFHGAPAAPVHTPAPDGKNVRRPAKSVGPAVELIGQ